MDAKNLAQGNELFGKLDIVVEEFKSKNKDTSTSNIKPSFITTLKELELLINGSNFDNNFKNIIKNTVVVDFHLRYSEENNINIEVLLNILGTNEIFNQSLNSTKMFR